MFDTLLKKMDALQSAVKGNYTDETARQLEIQLKQLQQIIKSLSEVEPDSTQQKAEPTMTSLEAKNILINSLR